MSEQEQKIIGHRRDQKSTEWSVNPDDLYNSATGFALLDKVFYESHAKNLWTLRDMFPTLPDPPNGQKFIEDLTNEGADGPRLWQSALYEIGLLGCYQILMDQIEDTKGKEVARKSLEFVIKAEEYAAGLRLAQCRLSQHDAKSIREKILPTVRDNMENDKGTFKRFEQSVVNNNYKKTTLARCLTDPPGA